MSNEILGAFRYGLNYDYHFIVKKNKQISLRFNWKTQKRYKTFPVPSKKEVTKSDKDCN